MEVSKGVEVVSRIVMGKLGWCWEISFANSTMEMIW